MLWPSTFGVPFSALGFTVHAPRSLCKNYVLFVLSTRVLVIYIANFIAMAKEVCRTHGLYFISTKLVAGNKIRYSSASAILLVDGTGLGIATKHMMHLIKLSTVSQ